MLEKPAMKRLSQFCISALRKMIPAGIRRLIRGSRSRSAIWTEAKAITYKWYYQRYHKSRWEEEYQANRWEYMKDLKELGRYSIIAGYIRYLKPAGSILDLGCGEGILLEHLRPESYSGYVGVDMSQEAIQKAQDRHDGKTTFISANITTFVPDRKYDAIVFNEVLYYLDDPLLVMKRYENFLKPNGVFIVGMYATDETMENWRALEIQYDFLDETRSYNKKSGHSWSCRVWTPMVTGHQDSKVLN